MAGPKVMAHDYGDEVVVANLDTGWFYSLTGTHRLVWCALCEGHAAARLAAATGEPLVLTAIADVLEVAVGAGLLLVSDLDPPANAPTIHWEAGSIESFDDLQDALVLDPVHDVADAGWPHPSEEA